RRAVDLGRVVHLSRGRGDQAMELRRRPRLTRRTPAMRAAHSLTLLLTQAANAVEAGELVVEPPTLINLGFEWWIEGDDNRNASVAVSFRVRGATDWR